VFFNEPYLPVFLYLSGRSLERLAHWSALPIESGWSNAMPVLGLILKRPGSSVFEPWRKPLTCQEADYTETVILEKSYLATWSSPVDDRATEDCLSWAPNWQNQLDSILRETILEVDLPALANHPKLIPYSSTDSPHRALPVIELWARKWKGFCFKPQHLASLLCSNNTYP
jgi:hypothetical protein